MSQIADLLKVFVNAGPNLPAAFVHYDAGVTKFREGTAEFQAGSAVLIGASPHAAAASGELILNDEEQALLAQADQIILEHGGHHAAAIGDGSLIKALLAFLQSNPQLLTLILSLLVKK